MEDMSGYGSGNHYDYYSGRTVTTRETSSNIPVLTTRITAMTEATEAIEIDNINLIEKLKQNTFNSEKQTEEECYTKLVKYLVRNSEEGKKSFSIELDEVLYPKNKNIIKNLISRFKKEGINTKLIFGKLYFKWL